MFLDLNIGIVLQNDANYKITNAKFWVNLSWTVLSIKMFRW